MAAGRVIAAVNASAAVRPVLSAAAALAKILGAGVDAIHVEAGSSESSQAAAVQAGLPLRVLEGSPAEVVAEVASESDAVALVVGSRGTPGGRRPVGSTARDLVLRTGRPVLVVPPQCPYPVRLDHWLIPLEASPAAVEPLRELIDRACSAQTRITVLHVVDEASVPTFQDQAHYTFDAWSREFLQRYCSHPEAVEIIAPVGITAEKVLEVADEVGADLIALVWSQDLGEGRAPVVRAALERSSVPVLLVPASFQGSSA